MRRHIPQASPALRLARYRPEIESALDKVLAGQHFILGPEVAALESEFATYCGAQHAVGVGSGTDAIYLALRAAGIGPDDEVLVPAFTAAGTVQAVHLAGATPKYIDVDRITRGMAVDGAQAAIGSKTAAIVLVHLYGTPADAPAFAELAKRHGLFFLEDCAQAHGALVGGRKVGTFGHAAAFSFYPTKNLGALGDGGAVTTSDKTLSEKIRRLRNFGWSDAARVSTEIAGNSRLDEIQAAILRVMLRHLDDTITERRALAEAYHHSLSGAFVLPEIVAGSVWHQFVIEVHERDTVMRALSGEGIGTTVHYDPPLHHQPALAPAKPVSLPVTEQLANEVLSLPIQPEVLCDELPRVAEALNKVRPK